MFVIFFKFSCIVSKMIKELFVLMDLAIGNLNPQLKFSMERRIRTLSDVLSLRCEKLETDQVVNNKVIITQRDQNL